MQTQIITGNLVDIFQEKVFVATVSIQNGKILSVTPLHKSETVNDEMPWLIPGLIDAHVHIESSMLIPSEFARLAVVHGTVATVSDPHEIANVCGLQGVDFMIRNGQTVPFKFYFGAPSCVPATIFETAGASLDAEEVTQLLQRTEIRYLSEMMNFPGVLHGDDEVMKKIRAAQKQGKPVDGHAPGLRGESARKYIDAGISTDHECFTREEALEKLRMGMKIIIREGSAARNFEALIELLHDFPDAMMFCSDDKHPDSLVAGHINQLCARAVAKGVNIFKVLKAACINPILHYGLDIGMLRPGDPADFIVVKDLKSFEVLQTYINGKLVAENGKSKIGSAPASAINNFQVISKKESDFATLATTKIAGDYPPSKTSSIMIPVIEALEGQLITNKLDLSVKIKGGLLQPDIDNDLLKIAVVNRYKEAPVSTAFIRNFGLKKGAIASSVAHDSHNVVAVGADDTSLCRAVNLVIENKGGISCVDGAIECVLSLPVAGLMSDQDGYEVADAYTTIDSMAKSLGTTLNAPFMTLSFMALLVIPHLKLSDQGLFDGDLFKLIDMGAQ